MHLPDGFLTAPVTAGAAAAAVAGLIPAALKTASRAKGRVAFGAATAAAVFAAQAANMPTGAGVSAHLLGGAALGALFGFAEAAVLVAIVVVAQATYGDGGVASLGANLLNMAVIAPLVAAWIARDGGPARRGVAAAIGTAAAVAACTVELVLSGRGPAVALFGDMARFHLPVVALEGAAAWGLAAFVARPAVSSRPARVAWAACGALAVCAVFACSSPDGLEATAERLGFAAAAK